MAELTNMECRAAYLAWAPPALRQHFVERCLRTDALECFFSMLVQVQCLHCSEHTCNLHHRNVAAVAIVCSMTPGVLKICLLECLNMPYMQ